MAYAEKSNREYTYKKDYESKEKKRLYDKAYYQKNKAKKDAQNQIWTEKNREKSRSIKKKYSDSNRLMWRMYCHARRTKTKGKINPEELHNWDSRICGLCSQTIEGSFHLDHILPLSRGGEHKASNLQLTHPHCNLVKSNRIMAAV